MRLTYKKLGEFIRPVDERNSDGSLGEDNLYGISVTKDFIVTHANLVGVTFDSYKVVAPRQFAYIPDTSRRGDKIAISLNTTGEKIIVSSICTVFEIADEDQLLPEYLMLWFMRPEFDRYARFMSNGSAREVFDWDCMCGVEIPVPSIDIQRKTVHDFQVITDRIALLRKMNSINENLIKTLYRKVTKNSDREKKTVVVRDFCKIFTGKKDVNQAVPDGKYRFYSCSPIPVRSNDIIYEGQAILVAGNGSYTGRTTFVDEAFDLYQRTYALTPLNNECLELFLIYAALQTDFQEKIQSKLHGSAIPYIVYGDLADFSFDVDTEYKTIAQNIKVLIYSSLKNEFEINNLISISNMMLSYISSSVDNKKDV